MRRRSGRKEESYMKQSLRQRLCFQWQEGSSLLHSAQEFEDRGEDNNAGYSRGMLNIKACSTVTQQQQ